MYISLLFHHIFPIFVMLIWNKGTVVTQSHIGTCRSRTPFVYCLSFKKINVMRLIKLLTFSLLVTLVTLNIKASNGDNKSTFDWTPLITVISKLESGGNPKARNGQYIGILQISPGLVNVCNNILKGKGSSDRFTLNDRYSKEKSIQMFTLFMERYNPTNCIDKAIRMWKGGTRYSIKATQSYVNRVMRLLK